MAVSKTKDLKQLTCKFAINDVFSNGNAHFSIYAITGRDSAGKLLKEPLYSIDRFPDAVYKDGKKVLDLKGFDIYESEIVKLTGFTWKKL